MNLYLLLWRRFLKSTRRGVLSFLSTFSIVGIALGVASLIIVLGIMTGFTRELENRLVRFTPHITIMDLYAPYMRDYEQIRQYVQKQKGVQEVHPFITMKTIVRHGDVMDGAIIKGVDMPYSFIEENVVMGSADVKRGAVLGLGMASALKVTEGDSIEIFSPIPIETPFGTRFRSVKLPVAGIIDAGIYDINNTFILVDLKKVQGLLKTSGVEGLEIYIDRPSKAPSMAARLKKEIPNVYVTTWIEMNKSLFSALQLEKLGMFLVLLLITLVASFNIISTLVILVRNKGHEIGILRAMGMNPSDLMRVFFLIGVSIGGLGVLIGDVLGLAVAFVISDLGLIRLPPDVYFIDRIPIEVTPRDFLLISAMAMLVVIIFSIIPLRSIVRMKVVDALRRID